jgi:hypothetical protein
VLDLNGGDGWTLNDAIFAGTHSVAGKIEGGIYAEQGDSLAALTTDPGITTHMDVQVPRSAWMRESGERALHQL